MAGNLAGQAGALWAATDLTGCEGEITAIPPDCLAAISALSVDPVSCGALLSPLLGMRESATFRFEEADRPAWTHWSQTLETLFLRLLEPALRGRTV